MQGADADDYAYRRRTPPGVGDQSAVLASALAKDARRRTSKERKAVLMARQAERAEKALMIEQLLASFASVRAICRQLNTDSRTVKRVREEMIERIASRSDGEKKAQLVALAERHITRMNALADNPQASRTALAWADFLARIDGVYAPTQSRTDLAGAIDVNVIEATVESMIDQYEAEAAENRAHIVALPASHPAVS